MKICLLLLIVIGLSTATTVRPGDNLQSAISAASNGETIIFDPGTYALSDSLLILSANLSLIASGDVNIKGPLTKDVFNIIDSFVTIVGFNFLENGVAFDISTSTCVISNINVSEINALGGFLHSTFSQVILDHISILNSSTQERMFSLIGSVVAISRLSVKNVTSTAPQFMYVGNSVLNLTNTVVESSSAVTFFHTDLASLPTFLNCTFRNNLLFTRLFMRSDSSEVILHDLLVQNITNTFGAEQNLKVSNEDSLALFSLFAFLKVDVKGAIFENNDLACIYCVGSGGGTATIVGSSFTNNLIFGVQFSYNIGGLMVVDGCTFDRGRGLADIIVVNVVTLTRILNCTITDSVNENGAIWSFAFDVLVGQVEIDDVRILGSRPLFPESNFCPINNLNTNLTVSNSQLENNVGNQGGGICLFNNLINPDPVRIYSISNCSFVENTSNRDGGCGFITADPSQVITFSAQNNDFRGNVAKRGGGVFFFGYNYSGGDCADNTCDGNSALYGNNYASGPVDLTLIDKMLNIESGNQIALSSAVIDLFGNYVATLAGAEIIVSISDGAIIRTESRPVIGSQGVAAGSHTVFGVASTSYTLTARFNDYEDSTTITFNECSDFAKDSSEGENLKICFEGNVVNNSTTMDALKIVFGILAGVAIAFALLCCVVGLMKKYKPFQLFPPIIGCILLQTTTFLIIPNPNQGLCVASLFLLGIGGSLVVGSPIAVLAGLYFKSLVVYCTTIVMCVTAEIIFLVIWSAVDTLDEATNIDTDTDDVVLYCGSTDIGWPIAQVVAMNVVLFIGVVLSQLQAKDNKSQEFLNSYLTSAVLYVIVFVEIVIIPILFVLDAQELENRFVFTNIGLLLLCVLIPFIMVLLPMLLALGEGESFSITSYSNTFSSSFSTED